MARERHGSKKTPRAIEFASKQTEKEFEEDLPKTIGKQFAVAMEQLSWDLEPGLTVSTLSAAGKGVLELKINGRPAWRLVYTLKFEGKLVVLAARRKTTNGPDRQLIEVAASRLKSYSS